MIYPTAGILLALSMVLFGPSMPFLFTEGFVAVTIILAILSRRSFHRQTLSLLAILTMMSFQGFLLVLLSLYIELFRSSYPRPGALLSLVGMWSYFPVLFNLNLWFAQLGAVAAAFVAVYIYFGKSRLEMSQVFPGAALVECPTQLSETVAGLATRANIKCPEVCLIESGTPLALTVRTRRKCIIAGSVGLLECFDTTEVEACVAHEIAHLKNDDFTIRFLATLARVALFSKPLSYFIEPAIYRAREFQADKTAASLIGGPDALISVLTKLRESNSLLPIPTTSGSVCACFLDCRRGVLSVFDKHPTLDSRIRLLEESKSS
jgi:heat shock protein HtpX